MNDEILEKLKDAAPSKWKQDAEYRRKNKWLDYSGEIAVRILAAIEGDKELNKAKLADLLDVSLQHVSEILKGYENLTLETIYKISKALDIELITFPEYKYSKAIKDMDLK